MGSKRDKMFLKKIFGDKTLDDVLLMETSFLEKRDHYEKEHLKAVIEYTNYMETAYNSSKLYEDELNGYRDRMSVLIGRIRDFEASHETVLAKVKNLTVARKNLVDCIGTMNDLASLENFFERLVKVCERAKKIAGSERKKTGQIFHCKNSYLADETSKKALYGEAEMCFGGVHKLSEKLGVMVNLAKIMRIKTNTEEIKDFFVDMVFEDFGEFKAAKGNVGIDDFLFSGCRMLDVATVSTGHKEKKELCDWITDIHVFCFLNDKNDIFG